MADDRSHALTFLYKIIDDNQSTIRFLDTKAAFGIAVLGALAGKFLDQFRAVWSSGILSRLIAMAFAVSLVVAATIAFKTVFPMVNPARNVEFPDDLRPRFFITKLGNARWFRIFSSAPRFAKLAETHGTYSDDVSQATPNEVEKILCAEVLKLSFIRQMKTDRLAAFAWTLVVSVIIFVALACVASPVATTPPSCTPTRGYIQFDQSVHVVNSPKQ